MIVTENLDFLSLLEPKLAAERESAIQWIRRLLNQEFERRQGSENKPMTHCIFEYLLGLDHAILAYPRDDQDTDLSHDSFVIFSGLKDEIIHREREDDTHGTKDASKLRHDNNVADRIGDWFDTCWAEAGGKESSISSYWMFEGDSDLYNMQTQTWE
jgi:hypothetical protein